MKVVCLCPTFNRANILWILGEAVESFLRQDYENLELLICNDTPGQILKFDHPKVRVVNLPFRFPTLGEKLRYMIGDSQADAFCRWDDDDISFPWRISMSVEKMRDSYEWRAENHWYYPRTEFSETQYPGNTHVFSIWRKEVLNFFRYPVVVSGAEDQAFNKELWKLGFPRRGELLPRDKIFYIYRWNTGSAHLSGHPDMNEHYRILGEAPIAKGEFEISPGWKENYLEIAKNAA
jgi:glycosyltransferase involved in cell wall biosynthesis